MPLVTKTQYRIECDGFNGNCTRVTAFLDDKEFLVKTIGGSWKNVEDKWFCPMHDEKEINEAVSIHREKDQP